MNIIKLEEVHQVSAEAYSDDHVINICFDAVDYISKARIEELQSLIKCDWGGDLPGDCVAYHYESTELKRLFDYVHSIQGLPSKKDDCGFECHVDGDQALEWLQHNRPEIWQQLNVSDI
jgi:hypothetical protein